MADSLGRSDGNPRAVGAATRRRWQRFPSHSDVLVNHGDGLLAAPPGAVQRLPPVIVAGERSDSGVA